MSALEWLSSWVPDLVLGAPDSPCERARQAETTALSIEGDQKERDAQKWASQGEGSRALRSRLAALRCYGLAKALAASWSPVWEEYDLRARHAFSEALLELEVFATRFSIRAGRTTVHGTHLMCSHNPAPLALIVCVPGTSSEETALFIGRQFLAKGYSVATVERPVSRDGVVAKTTTNAFEILSKEGVVEMLVAQFDAGEDNVLFLGAGTAEEMFRQHI